MNLHVDVTYQLRHLPFSQTFDMVYHVLISLDASHIKSFFVLALNHPLHLESPSIRLNISSTHQNHYLITRLYLSYQIPLLFLLPYYLPLYPLFYILTSTISILSFFFYLFLFSYIIYFYIFFLYILNIIHTIS